jgi:hypothetical protein
MPSLNNTTYVDRHNSPAVTARVGLRAQFINDGLYTDPYQISGVTVFDASAHFNPASLLGVDGLIKSDQSTSSLARMHFSNSSVDTSNSAFDVTNYTPATTASGIYREGPGKYIVILDGTLNLSGVWNLHGSETIIANTAVGAKDYVDIWTIQSSEGSLLRSVINDFTLKDDTFVVLTQPLILTVSNKLSTRHVQLGSKEDLNIFTEVVVGNKDLDPSVRNLFKDALITSAAVEIVKLNDDSNLPSRVEVSGWSDTSSLVDVTSNNTLILSWDTRDLATHAEMLAGNLGSQRGPYQVRVRFWLLNELIVSPPMNIIVS